MKIGLKKRRAFKNFLFQEGRLLERKIYSVIFENEPALSFLKTLKSYQNFDDGFGNGIEPDLLTPSSTGIGAETTLCLLDMMNFSKNSLIQEITAWVCHHINEAGILPYPPKDIMEYPHQTWWENPDDDRILAVSGLLSKFNKINLKTGLKINHYVRTKELPQKIEMYNYPLFVYALYHKDFKNRVKILNHFLNLIPDFIVNNKKHHPLFSRYWYHAIPLLPQKLIDESADYLINNIQEDGGIENPYPQLPWWRPIFTLDAFLLLKRHNYLK